MPYYGRYVGDYGTGGYYRGDPGFLSNIWKGIKRVAAPIVGGALLGPVGAAIGTAATMPKPVPTFPAVGQGFQPPTPPAGRIGPMAPRPGGQTRIGPRTGGVMAQAGCCPTGYHLAKDGSGRCVRNRRMNPANPKALRRAIRRTDGFVKLAKRALKGTGYAVRRA